MSVFRFTLQGFIFASLLAVLSCKSIDYPQTAWWYDIVFEANQTTIRGVDLDVFGKSWNRARLLSVAELTGRISQHSLQRFLESDFSFEKKMDLNNDNKLDNIVVGVYEKVNGTKGRFLAVFEGRVLVAVLEATGSAGFSALLIYDNRLRWYRCMECSDFETLVWSGTTYYLE